MPIRMTDDDPGSPDDDDSGSGGGGSRGGGGSGGGGGGGGGLFALLGLVTFIFRYPKIAAVVAVILVAAWFFSGGSSSTQDGPTPPPKRASSASSTTPGGRGIGATLDQKVYDETLVHEPLAEGQLPARVSLLQFAPPRRNQGRQGSCVGWATSYAARSILHAREAGERGGSVAFSPAFIYNPIHQPGCNGTFLKKALDELKNVGDLPLNEFAYTDRSCDNKPDQEQKQRAAEYRIAGYTRLSVDSNDYRNNALALKQHLAQGAPVVIGMNVGGTFESKMDGHKVWHPTSADYDMSNGEWGGHAMAVIGYDDTLEGGAFQLMNSWGPDWGEDGVGFVRYKDFDHFVKEAYGLYPMGGKAAAGSPLEVTFGFLETGTQRRIAVAPVSGITFRTVKPIQKGTRFKVEFSNTRPSYTYLFGQETDGSSYVLFPYTAKHSPYCGTTGTRIFPRKQSLTADNLGTRDSVAVVISPEALDYQALNSRIDKAPGKSYADKLQAALGAGRATRARLGQKDGMVALQAEGPDADKLHALVLEFDKQ